MRITDTMLMNNMLLSSMRNRQTLDKLQQQYHTLKKIQVPSDNPIIAARALRFRTNVSEIQQYGVNVKDGISWMSVSEQALFNTREILDDIRERCVQGASGNLEIQDQKAIASELKQLRQQLTLEANVNYAGRYVFSGYKTDEKYIFDKEQPDLKYEITQTFTGDDIKAVEVDLETKVYRYRLGYEGILSDVTKLQYIDSNNPSPSLTVVNITVQDGKFYTLDENGDISSQIEAKDFKPENVYISKETGELFFNSKDVEKIKEISFTYEKEGFESGDINPMHIYDCKKYTKKSDGTWNTVLDNEYQSVDENLDYSISIGNKMSINTLGKDFLTPDLLRDIDELIDDIENYDPEVIDKKPHAISLTQRFNAMLGKMDQHLAIVSKEHSDIGSRMKRLELTENRLSEDKINFQELMSENEDVDLTEIVMLLNNQELVYQASLMASAKILQPSLVNFIQ
mgnify:CR=1 FL=1